MSLADEFCSPRHVRKELGKQVFALRLENAGLIAKTEKLAAENALLRVQCGEVKREIKLLAGKE